MKLRIIVVLAISFILTSLNSIHAQGAAEVCGDSAGSSWATDVAVYGKINLIGFPATGRLAKITVTVSDRRGNQQSYTIDRNGHFCFRGFDGGGGTLILELEGREIVRRTLGSTGQIKQIREDFDLYAPNSQTKPPSTISAKFIYQRSGSNADLFDKAVEAEEKKDLNTAEKILTQLIAADPKDYIAMARLGSVQYEKNDHKSAETSYKSALTVKPDFSYAMMNLGRIYLLQSKVDAAIKYLEQATTAEPNAPRGFQLLGEAYLLAKKGTLGVEALYTAIELDPIGMAECHLLVARLFDRAGAKGYASREYRIFLEKVPNHAERAKFEKYIKDNPETTN